MRKPLVFTVHAQKKKNPSWLNVHKQDVIQNIMQTLQYELLIIIKGYNNTEVVFSANAVHFWNEMANSLENQKNVDINI